MSTNEATWTDGVIERLFDVATVAIAFLYWKIVESEDQASLERVRVYDAAARE